MRQTLSRLEKRGKKVKQPMQRYKGLGRWTPTSSPRRRWTRGTGPCAR